MGTPISKISFGVKKICIFEGFLKNREDVS